MRTTHGSIRRILVIRRDNIGDLVCTTPMLSTLRRHYPEAWIAALVNAYNEPVLRGNPDVDEVFAYQKAKHRAPGASRLAVWLKTATLLWKLRNLRIDLAIVASPGGERFARLVAARQIVAGKGDKGHEVEICHDLLQRLGISGEPGPLSIYPDKARLAQMAQVYRQGVDGPVLGIHVSARKRTQRWAPERFADLARSLLEAGRVARVLFFWAPGGEDDPLHPGDDGKAARILSSLSGLQVMGVPTGSLEDLIAGLALCDRVICADGGAMHVAAALGKPMVCLFGNSGAARWRPWGVPHQLLQPESLDVADISVADVLAAWGRLPSY